MDFDSRSTKRVQVTAWFKSNIADGTWQADMALPNVHAIADDLGCSMEVVRRVEHELARDGWITRPVQGMITRVLGRPAQKPADLVGRMRELHGEQGRLIDQFARLLGVSS
jgi:DNA-binding GntR family transcriptional regulator